MTAYSLGDVARIVKVPPERLRYWERTALLAARPPAAPRPAFSFADLVGVKALVELLDQGVPLRRIRRSVEAVRARMPELERPLHALRLWPGDSARLVVRHEGVLVDSEGQVLFDFSGGEAEAPGSVASLAPRHAALRRERDREAALAWFERGCALDGDAERSSEAADAYRRAIAADPDFADAHCNLGALHLNRGRRAEARACFERVLALAPRHLEAHLNLATLLEDSGRNQAALRHYRVALEIDPLCADIHLCAALLYEKLGLLRRARGHWRHYLRLDPSGAWADFAAERLKQE